MPVKDNNKFFKLLRWLFSVLIFVIIPASFIYFGFSRLHRLELKEKCLELEHKISSELKILEETSNTQAFLAKSFHRLFYKNENGEEISKLKKFRKDLGKNFDFIAWDSRNRIVSNTISPDSFKGNWRIGLKSLRKGFAREEDFSSYEEINYKSLFGSQFLPESARECVYPDNENLVWPDANKQRPKLWFGNKDNLLIAIFIKQEIFSVLTGLDYYLLNFTDPELEIGYKLKNRINTSQKEKNQDTIPPDIFSSKSILQQTYEAGSKKYFKRDIDEDFSLFAWYETNSLKNTQSLTFISLALAFILLMLPFIILSYKEIVLNRGIRLSISLKLLCLFAFSSGLPLSILGFVGYEYLNRKEYSLLDEMHKQGTRFLQNFDEQYNLELSKQTLLIKNAVNKYLPVIKTKGIEPESYFSFVRALTRDTPDVDDITLLIVASNSKIICTESAIYKGKKEYRLKGFRKIKSERKTIKIFRSMGKYLLNVLNGKPISEKVAAEVEIICESAMQKSIHEVQQEFLAATGKISNFGLGTRQLPTYVDFLSTSDNGLRDYVFMLSYADKKLAGIYLRRQFLNANRNIDHLQINLISTDLRQFYPRRIISQPKLVEFAGNLTLKPLPARQFLTLNHQEFLSMGMKGKHLKKFYLLALYPTRIIKHNIIEEKRTLIFATVFALLLILLIGNLLAASFIEPLKVITSGAEAIKNKNFDMRLPNLGNDEFGEIAKVFNETMIDFGELKVAGFIQEQLLPQKKPETGRFDIFGKSISMGDVGGDYYDYLSSGEDQFCVLIGDVSGKGVAAALIMAMAKAGVLKSEEYLTKPATVLQRIDALIKQTHTGGNKRMMSFQYINFNSQSGEGIYANARGMPLLLVDPEKKTTNYIELEGPLLGSSENPEFKETRLRMKPGQALLMYSDGFVNSQDVGGKTIGAERFSQIAIKSFNPDPEIYFQNILNFWQSHIAGSSVPSDDASMIIIIFR
jgi:serine phosphatase RsbU (regulator of sigma subunit)